MKEYHKIDSIFKRDEKTHEFIIGDYSKPEFEYLKNNVWSFTEKIDGTNIRVIWQPQEMVPVRFAGKTDDASIPASLIDTLSKIFTYDNFVGNGFGTSIDDYICLYGEGCGAKIQKGGGNYKKNGQDFILFDVRVGRWWLKREAVEDIGKKLGIGVVPIIGEGTLDGAIKMCQEGFKSQWGDFIAEGIVLKPKIHLTDRGGNRIITKVKYKDFR